MDIAKRKEFYEKVYFYELDRRDRIYTKLRLPLTILIFMGSINFFLLTKFTIEGKLLLGISFVMLMSILILISLSYCIYKVLTGWTYHEIALKGFEKHYDKLVEYYKDNKEYYDENCNEQELELMAKAHFERNLAIQLMEYADRNHEVNREREIYILIFIELLPVYALILAGLYVVPFV